MREPERPADVQRPMRRLNPTLLALLAGLVVLLLLIAYFASSHDPDQDKLKDFEITSTSSRADQSPEKRCSSKATYDLVKRDLFRRAAQLRGSDQAAYDRLAAYASLRMENPVLEGENEATGAVSCSGSLSLDVPPGVAVAGGRRSLTSDVDYTVQPAADGSGTVVLLRNADGIIAPLATLTRNSEPQQPAGSGQDLSRAEEVGAPEAEVSAAPAPPAAPRPMAARPSFNCANASTRGEIAVCSDAGLASLDRNMAAQYGRAMASASPEQQALLRRTRDRFLGYRDRCPNTRCMGDAYTGRMREISDIMGGRWQAPR